MREVLELLATMYYWRWRMRIFRRLFIIEMFENRPEQAGTAFDDAIRRMLMMLRQIVAFAAHDRCETSCKWRVIHVLMIHEPSIKCCWCADVVNRLVKMNTLLLIMRRCSMRVWIECKWRMHGYTLALSTMDVRAITNLIFCLFLKVSVFVFTTLQ